MKLRALIVAGLAAVLFAIPVAAVAKESLPTAATIHGNDLAAPITLRGNAEPYIGTDLAILVQHGGLLAAMVQPPQESGLVPNRPSSDLGARYTVTYLIPHAAGGTAKVRQDLYPYAAGGPVTYTPAGQLSGEGRRVQAGWWQATPGFRGSLIALGLPDRPALGAPTPKPAKPPAPAPRAASAAGWWIAGGTIASVLLLGAGTVLLVRRRPRAITAR
jgi:hypothetical protein